MTSARARDAAVSSCHESMLAVGKHDGTTSARARDTAVGSCHESMQAVGKHDGAISACARDAGAGLTVHPFGADACGFEEPGHVAPQHRLRLVNAEGDEQRGGRDGDVVVLQAQGGPPAATRMQ